MPSEVAKQTGMQKSTLEFWKAASTLWIVAAGMVAALFAAYLVFSHAGLRSANPSGDWAHHMALIDVLFNGEDVESRRPQLLIIADQPRWAHALAAWLAWATSLSPLRTIHIVAALAVILSVVVASARSVLVSLWVGRTGAGCVAGWLTGALTFWALTALGAGFDGQIKYNFFFAQAVGTAAALLALTLVQLATGRGGRLAMSGLAMLALASVPLVTLILAKIHIVPALWFAAAGSVCALSLELKLLRRLGVAVLIGGTSALLLLADHSTRAIMQLGQAGRGSLIVHGWGALFTLNTDPAVMIAGATLMAGLLILVALQGGPCSLRCRLFNLHAGAFAVLGLGALTLTALLFRGAVGYYALAKYVYLFGAEIALLTSHVAAAIARRSGAAQGCLCMSQRFSPKHGCRGRRSRPNSISTATSTRRRTTTICRSSVESSQQSSRRRAMKHTEPPSPQSCTRSSLFLIGKDSRGHWVVQDDQGSCGGLFVNRAEALKFAMFENGNRPQAVIMVPGIFELDMSHKAGLAHRLPPNTVHERQAA